MKVEIKERLTLPEGMGKGLKVEMHIKDEREGLPWWRSG